MISERHIAVKVCLGSSCYLRGGREILEALTTFISENKLEKVVELSGTLCEGALLQRPRCVNWVSAPFGCQTPRCGRIAEESTRESIT